MRLAPTERCSSTPGVFRPENENASYRPGAAVVQAGMPKDCASPPHPRSVLEPDRTSRRTLPRRQLLARVLAAGALSLAGLTGCKGGKSEGGPSSSGSTTPEAAEIVVGHYGSLTGNTAHFGQDTDKAVRLAVDEVNA